MTAIVMRDLSRRYGEAVAVDELCLEIAEGETFVLVGSSGSGKTTTLRMINRLVEPSSGELEVFGENALTVDPPALRRRIGYVIQEAGLFAHFTVARNVEVVPRLLGWDRARMDGRTGELLEMVGLPPSEFASRYPSELSGGQRQRVGIARALAADPSLVLLDEPFGALDPITRERIQDEFLALSARLSKTFVIVTHDIFEAIRLGDRIGVMDGGRLLRVASPAELVRDPGDPFVEAMLGQHRLQLRLMTLPLSSLMEHGADPPADSEAPTLPGTASAWDGLLAATGDQVCVLHDGRRRALTRMTLLEAGS